MTWKQSIRDELSQFDARIVMVFAMACILIVTYQYYFQTPIIYLRAYLGDITDDALRLYQMIAWHLGTLFILFVVPLAAMGIFNRFSSQKFSPLKYTFTLGDYRTGMKLVLLFVSVTVSIHLLLVLFGIVPTDAFPVCKSRLLYRYVSIFILFELTQCLYMIGFEYFFRGFVLIESERVFGYNALAVTLLPYIMIKLGKPPVEIYTAILVGIALGYMTIRTRSFWYAALSHCLLATIVDVWAVYPIFLT